ncbi:c-type cytochrome [Vogesella oryzae]|uniref:c-type cytochrome n=1 Tax=Vogesella oryzae TaxID=1735285 RepID=UPI001581CE89|nr:cytochrome c [Vogesella oryzae]
MKKLLPIALCCAFLSHAFAADPIKSRQQVFEQYKQTVGSMGKMVNGDTAFDKEMFAKLAAHMDELAQQPWQYFTPGSDKGKTEARPEIWSKPAEFKDATDKHKAAVAKLKTAAASAGSVDDVKAPFGAMQQTCKACHNQFRAD